MLQTIESVVNGMILQMREYGTLESTIHQYYQGFCKPIIRNCHERGDGNYSTQSLESFVAEANERLKKGLIHVRHFRSITRTARLLCSYALTGHTDFEKPKDHKKYIPSQGNIELIEKILSETSLQKAFKYRLHCCMRHFFCFIEQIELKTEQLTDNIFLGFISAVSETNKGSMGYIIYSLNLISNYLRENQIADIKADFSKFRLKAAPKRLIFPYKQDEISKMLACIDTCTVVGKRDAAILLLAFNTGLRAIDITKLQLNDIDWKLAELHIIQSKTKQPLSLPLNATVMNAIADYILDGRPKCNAKEVFIRFHSPFKALSGANALDGMIEKYCVMANIQKKPYRSFHSIRRAFATELSSAEVPLTTISQMLGHTDIDSDRPYLTYNKKQTSLCAIGFSEIPMVDGVYSNSYIPPIKGKAHFLSPNRRSELYKLPGMDFHAIPLRGGVYA